MEPFKLLSSTNQKLVIVTAILLVYGYLCRLLNLYIFWESKAIGWTLLLVTLIFLLRQRMSWKKSMERKTISEKIGIGVLIFVLFIQTVLFFVIQQTNAYQSAVAFIKNDTLIYNEIGEVKAITFLPVGFVSFYKDLFFTNILTIITQNCSFLRLHKSQFREVND